MEGILRNLITSITNSEMFSMSLLSRVLFPRVSSSFRCLSSSSFLCKKELGSERWHDATNVPATSKTYMWPSNNERVHLPEEGLVRPAYVCHMRSMIKYSPKKMWYFASFVRGMSVDEALKQLMFIDKKGAFIIREIIEEAVDLAIREHDIEYRTNLWVAESFTEICDRVKGLRRHARMRVGIVEYKYINYYIRLEEGKPPKNYYSTRAPLTPAEQLEQWLKEHRQKIIQKT